MDGQTSERAVVLASGGLDSTVAAAVARRDGYLLTLLTIDYQQRHAVEVQCAKQVANALGAERHIVVNVDLRAIGGSALTDTLPVPKDRSESERSQDVPNTYVPSRNLIFLSLAAAQSEVLGASVIYFGANVVDYSGYPDCRPEFIKAMEAVLRVGTKAGLTGRQIEIRAPLLQLSKVDIIRLGLALQAPLHLTHSCYDPVGVIACGHCDSCLIRRRGFAEAGVVDPIQYAVSS
ncbi:MAG: 7-cyano-7-deazaguanine synthase QueC [Nitrospira sp.]|nr:7-cyano-7-deazaguanine synthase QueC [Nitrospira sp.]MDH4244947.1 7-cyano-7-deazaguanine synthase QueC [Nitrospira sp.]MDH4357288.1 7-cyano-7-deazaguanine synthase QueC [Nitrospira sp.]MDH5319030.1 7-cyano-7-deazaguanine synthase QueC [Nitrospira sp.]